MEMKIKYRYLIVHLLKYFLLATTGFLLVFITVQMVSDFSDILKKHDEIKFFYYLLQVPSIFVYVAPVITCLSSLFLISEMLKNREIKILEICGVSPMVVYRVLFFGGILITALVFLINELVVPAAIQKMNSSKTFLEKVSFSSPQTFFFADKFTDFSLYG